MGWCGIHCEGPRGRVGLGSCRVDWGGVGWGGYLTENWHQLGTQNDVKTVGLRKVTPIYHDNVDEFWHVV